MQPTSVLHFEFAQRKRRVLLARSFLLVLFGSIALSTSSRSSNSNLPPVRYSDLCVTEGSLQQQAGDKLSVRAPAMRAYVNHSTAQDVEMRFTYLGPTEEQVRLGSGLVRMQLGLKLLAEDGCNLVYAMWRLEPNPKLVVSLKSNPGEHASSECANKGYKNIRATHSSHMPSVTVGQTHALRAVIQAQHLRVFADDQLVWQGTLGAAGLRLQGPVGIRSDNVRADFQLFAGAGGAPLDAGQASCKNTGKDSE